MQAHTNREANTSTWRHTCLKLQRGVKIRKRERRYRGKEKRGIVPPKR